MNYKTILVLAGDFNLIPCSAIYNYLARKSINLMETTAFLVFSFSINLFSNVNLSSQDNTRLK